MISNCLTSCFLPFPRVLRTPIPSLTGKVVDHDTNKPIYNAKVQFTGLKKTQSKTDKNGCFTTQKTKNFQFTIADERYAQQKLTLVVEAPFYNKSILHLERSGNGLICHGAMIIHHL